MTGQQLRNSILQEAIQGRLVPNVLEPGEKTGTELLQDILAERQRKENEEKGKKAKKLTLSTIEEEPWELPKDWCWCRGKDIFFPMESTKPKADFVYIDTDAVNNKKNIIDNPKNILLKDAPSRATRKLHANDILFSMVRPYLKNIAYVDDCFASAIGTTGFYVITTSSSIYQPYLFKIMLSDYVVSGLTEFMKGDNSPSINNAHIEDFLYPIPPLSIQHRIVEKIESLFPLVDEYDKAAVELETLNKILPDKLRKSVLQEAIHGNLVPNDIPEGEATASELLQQILKERQEKENKSKGKKAKKLTLSTIEEEPWELPEGWCWCKLKDIIDFTSSGTTKNDVISSDSWILDLEDIEKETGRLICKKRFGEVRSLSDKRAFKAGNVLYSKLRPYLNKCIIANEDGFCTTEILAFDFEPIYNRYAQVFLMSPYFVDRVNQGAAGVKMPRVNNVEANDTCFPLPPLSIQHRIVEKIEEVFSAIDNLQA